MFKIRHIESGRFLSGTGKMSIRHGFFRNATAIKLTSKSGVVWQSLKLLKYYFNSLERFFPGQFEVVEYVEKIPNN